MSFSPNCPNLLCPDVTQCVTTFVNGAGHPDSMLDSYRPSRVAISGVITRRVIDFLFSFCTFCQYNKDPKVNVQNYWAFRSSLCQDPGRNSQDPIFAIPPSNFGSEHHADLNLSEESATSLPSAVRAFLPRHIQRVALGFFILRLRWAAYSGQRFFLVRWAVASLSRSLFFRSDLSRSGQAFSLTPQAVRREVWATYSLPIQQAAQRLFWPLWQPLFFRAWQAAPMGWGVLLPAEFTYSKHVQIPN